MINFSSNSSSIILGNSPQSADNKQLERFNALYQRIFCMEEKSNNPIKWTFSIEEINFILEFDHILEEKQNKKENIDESLIRQVKKASTAAKEWLKARPGYQCAVGAANLQAGTIYNALFIAVKNRIVASHNAENCKNTVFLMTRKILLGQSPGIVIKSQSSLSQLEERTFKAMMTLKMPFDSSVVGSINALYGFNADCCGMQWMDQDTLLRSWKYGDIFKNTFSDNSVEKELYLLQENLGKSILDNVSSKSNTSMANAYFTPDLDSPELNYAYKLCEKFLWDYTNSEGETKRITFKKMQALYLAGIPLERFEIAITSSKVPPTPEEIKMALHAPWKVMSAEIATETGELTSVQLKPFIENMTLLKTLKQQYRHAIPHILANLTEDALFSIVLGMEFQVMDLHSSNIGLEPVPNKEFIQCSEFQFIIKYDAKHDSPPMNLKDFQLAYLAKHIHDYTSIVLLSEANTRIETMIGTQKELQKALKTQWRCVFFDNDRTLGESNEFYVDKIGFHRIPLRSKFLQLEVNNTPLSEGIIQRLMNQKGDLLTRVYLAKADAPIRKKLSKELLNAIDLILYQELHNHTYHYRRNNNESVANKLDEFVEMICYHESYQMMWKAIEDELKVDLKEESEEGIQRRKGIATQFFPRGTILQLSALIERQERRREYLTTYLKLKNEMTNGLELYLAINEFLSMRSCPIDSVYLLKYQQTLNAVLYQEMNQIEALNNIRTQLLQFYNPTILNIAKAMYPNLPNAYALNQIIYPKDAGEMIGHALYPLEKMINTAQTFKAEAQLLAEFLKQSIQEFDKKIT